MFELSRRRIVALASALLVGHGAALADDWPQRPITIVDPFPAGGGTDAVVRSLQPLLQKELGQPVIIDNRPGAGGTIGAALVAKARPDGYTLGIATTSTHATAASLYARLPYDPARDFEYVGLIGSTPYVLAANTAVAARDLPSLIRLLKAAPDKYTIASVGAGTVSHLMAEQFKLFTGVPLVHVPYRGAAPAYGDLIGGQVHLLFDNPIGLAPQVRAGKIVALASTGRSAPLPELSTFAQQGVAGFTQLLWYGLVLPKGTPTAIVKRVNAALNKVLSDTTLVADLSARGLELRPGPPEAMAATVAKDTQDWAKVVKAAGITLD